MEITHCKEGRLEYEGVEQFFYLGKGDVAIHCSSYDKAVMHCPTGEYQGISMILSRLVDTFFSRISLDYAATSKVP